jgi:hypothetical protein
VDGKGVLVLGGHHIHHYLVEPGYIQNIFIQKFPGKKELIFTTLKSH